MLSIGLMSGTSMDGIDAVLLKTDGKADIQELECIDLQYDPEFKILLHAAQYCVKKRMGDLSKAKEDYANFGIKKYLEEELQLFPINLEKKLSRLFAYAQEKMGVNLPLKFDDVIQHSTRLHGEIVLKLVQKSNFSANQIDLVGYHGQALYHQPNQGISIVLGDGQLLADTVKITVVNDFRRCDVAAGGQGAPFAPIFHQALAMRDNIVPAAVVNCGGIANVTLITGTHPENLIGFDTGPGNGLIDRLVRMRTSGSENIDCDGMYGQKGKVDKTVLKLLHEKSIIKGNDNYYDLLPPKSLDFGDLTLIDELSELSLEDACATLEAFTAEAIVASLSLLDLSALPKTWILAGGGWNNPVIKRELEERLREKIGNAVQVKKANDIGWNSQSLEAQIFAYFAVRSLQRQPLSVPNTTRVPKPLTGGHAFRPKTGATEAVESLLESNPEVLLGYMETGSVPLTIHPVSESSTLKK